ncbi:primosomal protein N' [Pendulispora albinea]|uniref:Replication restart protein PriA n=1 Tax=Pendulispora albinea TaxID=2741071 RepID=A0ABZ2LTA2_9BACT
MLLAHVALPVPMPHPYSYAIPARLAARVALGSRVLCSLGSRRLVGVVVAKGEGDPPPKVKPLLDLLDDEPSLSPALPEELLAFLRDLSAYYLAPIGEVMRLALPPIERAVARALEDSLFETKKGISARKVQTVIATDSVEAKALGGQAAAILAHVRAIGETPLTRLEERWKSARAAVKKLASLGLVTTSTREVAADSFFASPAPRDVPPELTAPQAAATEAIAASLAAKAATTFSLHGVTGSGKTEVYLRAIVAARAQRRGSIVLVPEIALTPQLVARFRARFGDDVAVLHSGLLPRERLAMWKRLRAGELDVAIGARSALFAPVRDLGLIVVDEEHDPSFKQEEGIRYHARDMAILRAHRASAVCILGSATPSLETEHLCRTGKAKKLVLPDRARAQAMPAVEIVDLRRMGPGPTGDKRISLPLHRALEATLAARAQAILFLNRRGFSPAVRCEACGELCACPSCSVALTFHKRHGERLRCHYCDYETPFPERCAKCQSPSLALEGLGTEKLEETLSAAFPEARVARLDRDVATGRTVDTVLGRMRAREIDILVGTQMVTKGHDLPHVTLVGVINADAALSLPDFRAAERAFHLLVQVAGRAGRGDAPGRVLIQTYTPDHPAIVHALRHDVNAFIERELADRREVGYPPYSRVALVRVDHPEESVARDACTLLAEVARQAAEAAGGEADARVQVLGPAAAPLARLRQRFRFRIMLRSSDRAMLRRTLLAVERARGQVARGVRTAIDIDPVQLL